VPSAQGTCLIILSGEFLALSMWNSHGPITAYPTPPLQVVPGFSVQNFKTHFDAGTSCVY
jgi:hypothetical protein